MNQTATPHFSGRGAAKHRRGKRPMDMGAVFKELMRLEKRDGFLVPPVIVDSAESPNSPLHDWFEWNNGDAAHSYRLWQARQLCNSYTVVMKTNGDTPVETKAFYSIDISDKAERFSRAYFSAEQITKDQGLRAAVIDEARRDLFSWRQRYLIVHKAFERIFAEIETLED